jgi:hypothetical protein
MEVGGAVPAAEQQKTVPVHCHGCPRPPARAHPFRLHEYVSPHQLLLHTDTQDTGKLMDTEMR